MLIVVLDADPAFGSRTAQGTVLAPIDYSELLALGELSVHQATRPEDVLERAQGASALLTNKVHLGRKEFEALPSLRVVSVLATGVNVVDLEGARDHGVTVCNVPAYSTDSTAQHCIALLLELTNRVGEHDRSVKAGEWERSEAFSYFLSPLSELRGKTIGIVGYGAIGAQVGRVAQALGMEVIAHNRSKKDAPGVSFVSKDELLRRSDVVSLHCPLTDDTRHFIDSSALRLMKNSALLLNCSRGPVVDEAALADALDAEEILGAATDVLTEEPPGKLSRLTHSARCIVTPHVAWATESARGRLVKASAENLRRFFQGRAQNVVAAPISPRS